MTRLIKTAGLLIFSSVIIIQGWRGSCNQQDIYHLLRRYKTAVVLLYDSSCMTEQAKRMKKTVSQLANSAFYPKKSLLFLSLDVSKSHVKIFMQDYNLTIDKFPALILFANSQLLQDQKGAVQFNGLATRTDIKKFIDSYLHLDLEQYAQEERVFKRYKNVIRDRAHVYYTPYFSKVANPWNDWWGWPYYGMSQGNYGGNMGINFFASNY